MKSGCLVAHVDIAEQKKSTIKRGNGILELFDSDSDDDLETEDEADENGNNTRACPPSPRACLTGVNQLNSQNCPKKLPFN